MGESNLVRPHLRIVKCHFGGMTIRVSNQANLPVVESVITRACDFLFIHIYAQCAALRNDGNHIGLVQAGRNGC